MTVIDEIFRSFKKNTGNKFTLNVLKTIKILKSLVHNVTTATYKISVNDL